MLATFAPVNPALASIGQTIVMKRIYLLAAEIFKYSYANYEDHLGVNERYDKFMPEDAKILEKAIHNKWPAKKVAEKLEVSEDTALELLASTQEALTIVDAENPAESFRYAVAQTIHYALEEGLHSQEDIEQLITQICYRAADLGFLLEKEGRSLSQYSRHLRRESEVGYHEGYFEEPFQNSSDA